MATLDGFKKYLSLRDHPFKSPALWLKGRAIDDACGGYWRIHDGLYDLSDFIANHPGGRQWIELTRGLDVTEQFETYHMNPSVKRMLAKFYHGPADGPRNIPFTFKPNGFYLTLKKRAYETLSKISEEEKEIYKSKTRSLHNFLLVTLAVSFIATMWTESGWMASLCGLFATLTYTCSHNFGHQKDNWRRYGINFGLYSSTEFRISHCLSHHAYPNTIYDLECSLGEPLGDYRVYDKSLPVRCLGLVGLFTVSHLMFLILNTRHFLAIITKQSSLRLEMLLPFCEIALFLLAGTPLLKSIELWLIIQAVDSYFICLIGFLSAHHHPDVYHAGDGQYRYGIDWGLMQLDAVVDRRDVNGNLFAELTMYGNHVLHHLFPTVDHGLLELLRPVFEETCKEFNLPIEAYRSHCFYSQYDMFLGYFRQILRTAPRKL